MRNKEAQKLLDKAIKLDYGDEIPLFEGIYIIQERRLHDSGYRLMNVIGHTEYDKELKDYKYYLISCYSDVIDFKSIYDMCYLYLDIDRNGLIHIWTDSNKKLSIRRLNTSCCYIEIVD